MSEKNKPPKVIKANFERWFTDADIDQLEERLQLAASVTIPKADALRIIRRMRAAGGDKAKK